MCLSEAKGMDIIMILGILSIIMPHTSIMAFIIRRIITLLLETASTDSLMVCGYRSIVRQRANAVAACDYKKDIYICFCSLHKHMAQILDLYGL